MGAASNVAIAGFIVTGNTSKQVVVRGLGPSLATAGVQGTLSDPLLELYDAGGNLFASNNDWQQTRPRFYAIATLAP